MSSSAQSGDQSAVRPWLIGPIQDLSLIVATPVLIVPLAWLIQTAGSDAIFVLIVAAFGQVGHNLPGLIRAYGDRELFQRYRTRFVVAPMLLGIVCILCAFQNLHVLILASVMWAIWHALMQTYGFVRIYASRTAGTQQTDRWLDFLMCIAWFPGALLLNPRPCLLMMDRWYRSGGLPVPAAALETLQSTWWTMLIVVSGLWGVRQLQTIWQHGIAAGLKTLLMGISVSFYWYAYGGASNILVGGAMFEVFHDVQYLTIVWLFNRKRVEQSPQVGSFLSFLFRRSGALVGLYIGLVFTFGSVKFIEHAMASGTARDILIALLATSGLLHYYYDGFIWKIRDSKTSETLGLTTSRKSRLQVPAARHAAKWAMGLVPVFWLMMMEVRTHPSELNRWVQLSVSLPENPTALRESARLLANAHREVEACQRLEQVLKLHPGDIDSRYQLAQLLHRRDRPTNAQLQCHIILQDDPDHFETRLLLSRLLAESDKPEAAEQQLKMTLQQRPDSAEALANLGIVLAMQGRIDDSVTTFQQALLTEDTADTHFNLANVLIRRKEVEAARAHYRRALLLDPDFNPAREALRQLDRPTETADRTDRQTR